MIRQDPEYSEASNNYRYASFWVKSSVLTIMFDCCALCLFVVIYQFFITIHTIKDK